MISFLKISFQNEQTCGHKANETRAFHIKSFCYIILLINKGMLAWSTKGQGRGLTQEINSNQQE